jgi:ribosome modulation factor
MLDAEVSGQAEVARKTWDSSAYPPPECSAAFNATASLKHAVTDRVMEEQPMADREAHDDGYDAYWEGLDRADNPHDADQESEKHNSWEEGWREARKHDYDEDD